MPVPGTTHPPALQRAPHDPMPTRTGQRPTGSPVALALASLALVAGCGRSRSTAIEPTSPSRPTIVAAYVGATPAGYDAPAYFVIEQSGGDDAIVSVDAEQIAQVGVMAGSVDMDTTNRPTPTITESNTSLSADGSGFPLEIVAGTRHVFGPGRTHLMLEGITSDLAPGEEIELRFVMERHAPLVVNAQVVQLADLLEVDIFWKESQ